MTCLLGQAGYRVGVYERGPDPREVGAQEGPLSNLVLSARGVHALKQAGVSERVLGEAVALRGRMIHSPSGALTFRPNGIRGDRVVYSVPRSALIGALLDQTRHFEEARIFFEKRCAEVDLDTASVSLQHEPTGGSQSIEADFLIAADGRASSVRAVMRERDRFNYQQEYLTFVSRRLEIPPRKDGTFRLESSALHVWPRDGLTMMALPNRDGSFTCTVFAALEGEHGLFDVDTDAEIQHFFEKHFHDAWLHMPSLLEDFKLHPARSLVTIRCSPWHYQDKVVLVGDAARTVVPFWGQEKSATLEDCLVLYQSIARHSTDLERAFSHYQGTRRGDADALADLAIRSFAEMRDQTSSPRVLLRDSLSRGLYRLAPDRFVPTYDLVTFTRTPYTEAVRRSERQNQVLASAAVALVFLVLVLLSLLV
jgi:kynurenine 3-monooxygenase